MNPRDIHDFVEAERMQELPEHQQVQLRGIRQLPRLYLPGGAEFVDRNGNRISSLLCDRGKVYNMDSTFGCRWKCDKNGKLYDSNMLFYNLTDVNKGEVILKAVWE